MIKYYILSDVGCSGTAEAVRHAADTLKTLESGLVFEEWKRKVQVLQDALREAVNVVRSGHNELVPSSVFERWDALCQPAPPAPASEVKLRNCKKCS